MFTEDSKKGIEVLEGFESALRLAGILYKITYGSELRLVARRILNDVNEFIPAKYESGDEG